MFVNKFKISYDQLENNTKIRGWEGDSLGSHFRSERPLPMGSNGREI